MHTNYWRSAPVTGDSIGSKPLIRHVSDLVLAAENIRPHFQISSEKSTHLLGWGLILCAAQTEGHFTTTLRTCSALGLWNSGSSSQIKKKEQSSSEWWPIALKVENSSCSAVKNAYRSKYSIGSDEGLSFLKVTGERELPVSVVDSKTCVISRES